MISNIEQTSISLSITSDKVGLNIEHFVKKQWKSISGIYCTCGRCFDKSCFITMRVEIKYYIVAAHDGRNASHNVLKILAILVTSLKFNGNLT